MVDGCLQRHAGGNSFFGPTSSRSVAGACPFCRCCHSGGRKGALEKSGFPNPFPILLALAILTGYLEGVRALSPIDPESLPDGGQVEMERGGFVCTTCVQRKDEAYPRARLC
ncbi:MAG: hypothetical protein ACLR23_00830 [Clostridia bacterium]